MSGIPEEKLDRLIARSEVIQAELSQNVEQTTFVKLSRELSELTPVVEKIQELRAAVSEKADLETMVAGDGDDEEMVELAKEELAQVTERLGELEQEVKLLLLPKDAADEKNAIVEVRAGTGGDEAALFAADLYRMYQRYADLQGWKTEIISMSENDLGGYKEVIASISGKGVFAKLKFESGVHRVQRVPATETQGRIHTSAATVAVLPEAEDIDIDIKAEDIRIDTMRAGGAGGQHVNTTDSAVRITHLPTGIIVVSAEKSQHQNRRLAMQVLRSRLFDHEREKAATARSDARKSQVGSGDRSQRIRTYNFPQGRVTDHRINLTKHNLSEIIAGDGLESVIESLITEDQASRLAALESDAG